MIHYRSDGMSSQNYMLGFITCKRHTNRKQTKFNFIHNISVVGGNPTRSCIASTKFTTSYSKLRYYAIPMNSKFKLFNYVKRAVFKFTQKIRVALSERNRFCNAMFKPLDNHAVISVVKFISNRASLNTWVVWV